jgi:hypothetical protein
MGHWLVELRSLLRILRQYAERLSKNLGGW